jgi:glycosyltransferase involved in cell wall biosynthesis
MACKRVSILGHFGFGKNLINGQTIKTKIVTEEIEKQIGSNKVYKIDTFGGKKAIPKLFFKAIGALRKSKNIIIMPAHNGLKFFAPILTFFNKFYKRKLFYVVIGGWLSEYLDGKKSLEKKLKKFDGVFVETETMKRALNQKGFTNVVVVSNCKNLDILSVDQLVCPNSSPYKLCTFSRVCKEKGIEDAVNAVISANEHFGRIEYSLDIYGQIDSNQKEWFAKLQETFPDYIKYGGLVPFDKSVEVLKDYFALLFPTFYAGEGFPGTIIDAYAAGLPVISSDWKYNPEIIKENATGFLFRTNNVDELKKILLNIVDLDILSLKTSCIKEAEKYLPKNQIDKIISQMELN